MAADPAPPGGPVEAAGVPAPSRWRRLRLIPALDESARVVAAARGWPGRILVALLFALLVRWHGRSELILAIVPSLLPRHRRIALALVTWAAVLAGLRADPLRKLLLRFADDGRAVGLVAPPWFPAAAALAGLGVTAGYVLLVRSQAGGLLRRRPVATWVALYLAALLLALEAPAGDLARLWLWGVLGAVGSFLWFGCYALAERPGRAAGAVALDLATMQPLWSVSHVPVPRAGPHLGRIEVAGPEEAARWQLKALKLLLWALLLSLARTALTRALAAAPTFDADGVPWRVVPYPRALALSIAGTPLPAVAAWAAVALTFTLKILSFAIWGHVVVAGCRFAGFKALRNTYRPFEAPTLADFWNRIYFYFKELLVEVFFFPTFVRHFKGRPRLRLVAATFAAAGLGNLLYHWLRDTGDIVGRGLWGSLVAMQTYGAYCLLLAAGIAASQLRNQGRRRPAPTPARRLATIGTIVLFYGLLTILDEAGKQATLADCGRFALGLLPGAGAGGP